MKNTTKKIFALATAGLIILSTTTAFANEGSEDLGLKVISETETNYPVVNNPETEVSEDLGNEVANEAPSVLPGDFFYFVKTALEKIKLAFTFDDAEEANLFATYAMERLAEAEALFENGQEDKALETIQDALANLNNAGNIVDEEKSTDDTEVIKEETITEEEPKTEEISDSTETEEGTTEELEDVEQLISQNIIALNAALERVKNPVAQAALQRNIEKSYEKLAKKLEKLEGKYVKDDSEEPNVDLPVEIKEEDTAETETSVVEETPNDIVTEENETEKTVAPKTSAKQIKAEAKEEKNKLKEIAKVNKKAEKFETKQTKKETVKNEKKDSQHSNSHSKAKGPKEDKGSNGQNGKDK